MSNNITEKFTFKFILFVNPQIILKFEKIRAQSLLTQMKLRSIIVKKQNFVITNKKGV